MSSKSASRPRKHTQNQKHEATSRRASTRGLWFPALILLAGAIVYANSLSNPFIFDDEWTIVLNESIRNWHSATMFSPARELSTAGRPLVNVSLAINYGLGGLNERGYHIVNLILHLGCALLILGCVRRTLQSSRMPRAVAAHAHGLAFAVALIWTIHPLNTEVVDYITQRTESMMALCYLLTLYASIRSWPIVAVLSCAAGMACKESMVTAPLIVWLHDRIFLANERRRWPMYAGLAATWSVLALTTWSGPRAYTAGFGTNIHPWTYLLNQTVIITRYLTLMVWPHSLVLAYGTPQPLTLVDVLPYAAFVALVLALTVVAFARWPLIGFAGVWLFTTLAPTSSIVPIATEVGAERRMYLPLVAPVTLAVVGLWMLWQRYAPGRNARILTVPLAGVAVWFGAATIIRNSEYSSKMTMAQTVLARWPTDVAHAMVGTELAAAGRRDEAIAEFRTAAPTFPIAAYKLGVELYNQQRFDAAVTELEGYIRREPFRLEAVEARTLIGRAYVLQHRWPESIEQFRLALSMDGSHVEAVRLMGDARFGQGDYAEAARMYRSFLAARPDDDEATINLAQALFNLGDLDGAAAEAAKLVRLARHEAVGHHLLGWVFATRGQLDDARVEFARALQLNPAQAEYRHDLDAVVEELARRR